MAEYVCIDGPLGGQQLAWSEATPQGEVMTIAVVDVGLPDVAPGDEPEADYRVERTAADDRPGVLRFVTGRGPWRPTSEPGAPVGVRPEPPTGPPATDPAVRPSADGSGAAEAAVA